MRSVLFAALLCLLCGGAYGLHETVIHHYSAFQARYPDANRQFWDASVSWTNKYEGGKVENGPAFPLSTSWLVWWTDGKHASGTAHTLLLIAASMAMLWNAAPLFDRLFPSPRPPRWQKWALWAGAVGAVVALRAIGFTLVYGVWF